MAAPDLKKPNITKKMVFFVLRPGQQYCSNVSLSSPNFLVGANTRPKSILDLGGHWQKLDQNRLDQDFPGHGEL